MVHDSMVALVVCFAQKSAPAWLVGLRNEQARSGRSQARCFPNPVPL